MYQETSNLRLSQYLNAILNQCAGSTKLQKIIATVPLFSALLQLQGKLT